MKILRTYARVYTAGLDETVGTLSRVTGQAAGSRFSLPNALELATVGRVHEQWERDHELSRRGPGASYR